ncbi:exported hypothetical protein [Thiomonas sp. CB2]|nr:exported hypothetical protein [Thiomonas sp. CB2]VDY07323.1 protein of unknown function [Thiomonas sp. Sup16B3]VDY17035.1 protein of unknown function [Thiomonas sp. CB2]
MGGGTVASMACIGVRGAAAALGAGVVAAGAAAGVGAACAKGDSASRQAALQAATND